MKVMQVVGAYAPERCGIAHYTRRLGRELARTGVEVSIASRPISAVHDPTAPSIDQPTIGDPPLLTIRHARWTLHALIDLVRLAERWRADWLHLQYAPSSYDWLRRVSLLPLVARLVPGAPRIAATIHEYGGWVMPYPQLVEPAVKRVFQLAEGRGWLDREALTLLSLSDQVIATNPKHRAAVASRSARLARRLQIVPIGPNVGPDVAPVGRDAARHASGIAPDRFIAVFFGFVHPVKGIETLLQAMARLHREGSDISLWIVGGVHSLALRGGEADGYEAKVRTLIRDLDLSDVVRMTGFRTDVEVGQILRAADIAVLPFNHGATMKSGTLVTCLSYGLPVVTTSGADLCPLRHGSDVWVVPPKDPTALAGALRQLRADAALRANLSQGGVAASAAYSWPRIAELHRAIYHT